MYCPSCGNAVSESLKYCNRCGASLGVARELPASGLNGPAWALSLAVALVTLGGLSMLFVIVLQLVRQRSDVSPGASIMMLAFLAVIAAVDWMLARQLSRVIDVYRREGGVPERARPEPAFRPELAERPPARLDAARTPFISVTEETTRTLDAASARERDTRPQ